MSLTSLLEKNPDLGDYVREHIPNLKPILTDLNGRILEVSDWRKPILVPSIGARSEAGTMGTAFDYMARAVLAKQLGRNNLIKTQVPMVLPCSNAGTVDMVSEYIERADQLGKNNIASGNPVAMAGAYRLPSVLANQDQLLMFEQDDAIREQRLQGLELALKHEGELMKYILDRLDLAMASMEQFIDDEIRFEQLAPHTIYLARLDSVVRAGSIVVVDAFLQDKFGKTYFSQKLSVSDDDLANNVVQLAEVFERRFRGVPMKHAMLNPTFAQYSCAVGGADADFIFDSTLVDLKSTKKLACRTEEWAQVLGYAAMAIAVEKEIDKAGIYFARFDVSTVLNITSNIKQFLSEYLTMILETAKP